MPLGSKPRLGHHAQSESNKMLCVHALVNTFLGTRRIASKSLSAFSHSISNPSIQINSNFIVALGGETSSISPSLSVRFRGVIGALGGGGFTR